jgi:hypothetical protein
MKPSINKWHGTIRLKSKNPNTVEDLFKKETFNFGEYAELKEAIVLDTWGDPHFGELRFQTSTKLAGLDEVRYVFNPGHNTTDTENIYLYFEVQHVFITPDKCYLLCNTDAYVRDFISKDKDEDDPVDPFSISIICEFENKKKLEQILKKLCKANRIPIWENNFKMIDGHESHSNGGVSVKGNLRIQYHKTVRYKYYQNKYYYKMVVRTNRPKLSMEVHLIMQKHYKDFDLLFQSPIGRELTEISTEHQVNTYANFISDETDETGTSFLIEQTIIIEGYIFLMGKMKVKGIKNEYDFYDCCLKFSVTNNRFEHFCYSFGLKPSNYWNLEHIDIEKLINN